MTIPPITACVWRLGPPRKHGQIEIREMAGLPWPTIRYGVYRGDAARICDR